MQALLMVNGEYGDLQWYKDRIGDFDYVLCTDGAASKARQLSILPNGVVGDMDSISASDLTFMEAAKVQLFQHPPEKDFTDMYLALEFLMDNNYVDITIWGGTGGRLDHTIGNLIAGVNFTKKGMSVKYDEPGLTIYLVQNEIKLQGSVGDTVSIFPMVDIVEGVTLEGFKYPLKNADLKHEVPIGISNLLTETCGHISFKAGILAIFHYCK